MKITKNTVDKLVAPSMGQKRYYDELMRGFGVRITAGGVKAFFVEKMINSKQQRITIGRYPDLTVEQARKEGQKLLGQIATGINPIMEKKARQRRGITLQEVFEDYLKARKTLKPLTVKDYQRAMLESFDDWRTKPLLEITRDMVAKRHS